MAAWLKEQGELISQPSLAAHKRAHLNVVADAKAVVEARAATLAEDRAAFEAKHPEAAHVRSEAVQKIVADVTLLDELAGHAMSVIRMLTPAMFEPSMAQSALYGATLKEVREIVKTRDELLHPDKDRNENAESAVFRVELSYPERPAPPECPHPSGRSSPPTDEPGQG